MEHIYDLIIIGGGPGGYTAALYGERAGLDTLTIEKSAPGGQMVQTHQIDNYPGFEEGIEGWSLAIKMQQTAERFGARTEYAEVTAVSLEGDVKTVETTNGSFKARAVIISTGANPRDLGIENENRLLGRGIHYCAACDGMFYKGKTVMVVGGGNTAATDAILLSRVAAKVILVHRRDTFKADRIYHAQLESTENIEILRNSTVVGLNGEDRLESAVVKNTVDGKETEIVCDGIFVSIGRTPATDLFKGVLKLDDSGYIVADETGRTDIPGVFAVGDVRTKDVRQVVTAVADGASALHYVDEYLTRLKDKK